ncbi:MAG: Ig-like domain-containing protein [Limisphaerales bacterium]
MKTRFNAVRAWCFWACGLAAIAAFLAMTPANAQPVILSTTPTNEAADVPTTSQAVFTFSESMNITNSGAVFFDESVFGPLSVSLDWSACNTVLTCTPEPPFPAESAILWVVDAHDSNGDVVTGPITGFFVTGSTNGPGGLETNPFTSFGVLDSIYYDQTSAGSPVPDPLDPYLFLESAPPAPFR